MPTLFFHLFFHFVFHHAFHLRAPVFSLGFSPSSYVFSLTFSLSRTGFFIFVFHIRAAVFHSFFTFMHPACQPACLPACQPACLPAKQILPTRISCLQVFLDWPSWTQRGPIPICSQSCTRWPRRESSFPPCIERHEKMAGNGWPYRNLMNSHGTRERA